MCFFMQYSPRYRSFNFNMHFAKVHKFAKNGLKVPLINAFILLYAQCLNEVQIETLDRYSLLFLFYELLESNY